MSALGPPCGSSDSFHTTVFVFHLPQPLPFRPPDVCVGSVGVYSPKQVGPEVALLWCYWCQPSLQLSDFSSCRQGILAPKACKTHSDCEQSTARPCCPAVHHRWGDSLSKSCKYGAKLQAKRSSVSELGSRGYIIPASRCGEQPVFPFTSCSPTLFAVSLLHPVWFLQLGTPLHAGCLQADRTFLLLFLRNSELLPLAEGAIAAACSGMREAEIPSHQVHSGRGLWEGNDGRELIVGRTECRCGHLHLRTPCAGPVCIPNAPSSQGKATKNSALGRESKVRRLGGGSHWSPAWLCWH